MRIVVLHSNANYLVGLRLPLMRELTKLGHEVVAIAPNMSAEHLDTLRKCRIDGRRCDLDATGFNPIVDLKNTWSLVALLKQLQPTVILTNTAKAVIYGTFAAKLAGVSRRYALVSGLGYAFTDDGKVRNWRKVFVRTTMSALFSMALRLNRGVIFQNRDDLDELCSKLICSRNQAHVVAGSGVDLDEFGYRRRDRAELNFILVGRLLMEKGVKNYLEAARLVKSELPQANFLLVGDFDSNPSALTFDSIQSYLQDGTVRHIRGVTDVRPWLYQAHIFVLPSYYREGVPRSTLEAMATGLAVITTDTPGCRETVSEGVNGLLVNVRDTRSLASAMIKLGSDFDLATSMGQASRRLAEKRFDVNLVNHDMCRIMGV
ncbi:glycosyltransferase family 4 protein [Dyella flava]|uniref:Glycosyltransferase family 4 protein n=1 Tax=Dyella flava TaxID=1920170 RepID=A0ABS2K073_9GAMM|nr:glycosyltransferase family 4 protein [Dyella flava]MBM7123985.1 glycosyltransferase family 4 protein [Dyella flava]